MLCKVNMPYTIPRSPEYVIKTWFPVNFFMIQQNKNSPFY
nr:MAG TPA: hypothetical protein [Caudoviricetes sp.]